MVIIDKQLGSQTTILPTGWSVLPEHIREQVANGIAGITRSLLPVIPLDLVEKIYAEGNDHRPVMFGPHIIMSLLYIEVTHITESYFLEHINTDAAMQYALMTETEKVQPFSESTIYRVRRSLCSIYEETGRDLLQEITDMLNFAIDTEVIGNLPYNELLDKVYRIDSLNINMHGRHMSRLELVYTCNRMNVNNVKALLGKDSIPEGLQHYLDKKDHNRVIYFKGTLAELEVEAAKKGISIEEVEAEAAESVSSAPNKVDSNTEEAVSANQAVGSDADASSSATEEQNSKKIAEFNRKKRCGLIARLRLAEVLEEALAIQNLVESLGLDDTKEYKLLSRAISEQTKQDAHGNVIPRENSEIEGSSLQNPYDDGSTCRTKDGKTEQGWTANVVQHCGPGNYAVIVDRDLEPNIHSDQAFARDFYQKFGTKGFDPETGHWNAACVDGLYCNSYELKELAASMGFKVFCGTLTGAAPDPILADFNVDLKNMTVTSCPNGYDVKKMTPHIEKEEIRIRMPAGTCSNCANCKKCGASVLKNEEGSILLKLKQFNEATTMHDLGDPTFRAMVNKRNGVEGVPSVLRRAYHIDQTTYFGKWYARYDLMLATTAMNMRVLLRFRQEQRQQEKQKAAA